MATKSSFEDTKGVSLLSVIFGFAARKALIGFLLDPQNLFDCFINVEDC